MPAATKACILFTGLVVVFVFTCLGSGSILALPGWKPRTVFLPAPLHSYGYISGPQRRIPGGMLLAAAIRNRRTAWLERTRFKTLIGFLGIFGVIYCIGLFEPDLYGYGRDHAAGRILGLFVLPVFVVLALAGLIYERTWLQTFFSSKLLVLLGNASFAFYLVHISYVNLKLRQWVLMPDRNFILLWIISIVLYLAFEKPIYNLCRKKLK